MVDRIILLSGPVSSGKSTLASGLASRYDMAICKTADLLHRKVSTSLAGNRKALQAEGERLDRRTGGTWVLDALSLFLREIPETRAVIVDSVRIAGQIQVIREAFGPIVTHVHLTAPEDELGKRYAKRRKTRKETIFKYTEVQENKTEQQVGTLANIADVVVDTNRCTEDDVLVRTAAHLGVRTGRGTGYVDVLVGGQYGSEGKGQIAAYLAGEYDLLVRVGGPNAGHKVYEEPKPYAHHLLPSGTRKSEAQLLLGPGAVIGLRQLLREIADCGVEASRLCVDGNAMIISEDDREGEKGLVSGIGSTGQGVGAATARRIMERGDSTALARDVPELRPYIGSAVEVLEDAFVAGKRVMLEGTQGTGLSLYHGDYPYVTSRDTTVSGCLAESGIAPGRVRRVIMVCRTYPIRVGSPENGTSGPLHDLAWVEIARRSGLDVKKLQEAERTTTTNRPRRIGEFEWKLLRRAALLNGATDIALTFTDYISRDNRKAQRFEQLTPETISFIQEVERVAGAPVSVVSTGFNNRSVIDRRSW